MVAAITPLILTFNEAPNLARTPKACFFRLEATLDDRKRMIGRIPAAHGLTMIFPTMCGCNPQK